MGFTLTKTEASTAEIAETRPGTGRARLFLVLPPLHCFSREALLPCVSMGHTYPLCDGGSVCNAKLHAVSPHLHACKLQHDSLVCSSAACKRRASACCSLCSHHTLFSAATLVFPLWNVFIRMFPLEYCLWNVFFGLFSFASKDSTSLVLPLSPPRMRVCVGYREIRQTATATWRCLQGAP